MPLPSNPVAATMLARLDGAATAPRQNPGSAAGFGNYPAGAGQMSPAVAAGSVASSYNWITGAPIAAPLPRDPLAFLAGGFGPTMPMVPFPLDVGENGERPDPRRWEYPVGYNLPSGVPGSEGLKLATFQNLRAFADLYSVARACLNVRENEILGIDWDIVPTDDAAAAMRSDSDLAEDFQKRVREAVDFFTNPDPEGYNSYHEWLRAMLEDLFVCDAVALYLHPCRVPGKGVLGSDLGSLDYLDGTKIKPLIDISGGRPRPPNPAYHQFLWGVARRELTGLFDPLAFEDDADLVARYRGDQLLYLRYQPRSFTPYGFSLIEQCILPIAIGVKGQQFTLDFFTEGSIPDTFIIDGRQAATVQQARMLQDQLNATAMDSTFRRKQLVLPYNSKPVQMKPQALTAGLDQVYAEQVAMVIDVAMHEIGLAPSRGSGLGGKGFQKGADESTLRKSLKPVLAWLKRQLFDAILQGVLRQADMQWKWKGFEPEEDLEKKHADLRSQVQAGEITLDEMRIDGGRDPFGTKITGRPHYYTAAGIVDLEDGSVIAISGGGGAAGAGGTAGDPGQPGPDGTPPTDGSGGTMQEGNAQIDHSEPVPETDLKSITLTSPLPAGFAPHNLGPNPPLNDEDPQARDVAEAGAVGRLYATSRPPDTEDLDTHLKVATPSLKTKLAVHYRGATSAAASCATCRFYRGEGVACALVEGPIQADGWCDLYEALPRGGDAPVPETAPAHTGAMIALVPPASIARVVASAAHLAVPAGVRPETAEDLHVTLAFIADAADIEDPAALITAVRAFAMGQPPITGYLNGANHWVGDDRGDGDPWVANVDAPALPDVRQAVMRLLAYLGIEPTLNHGANMHMTMAYLPFGSQPPLWTLGKLAVTFSELVLAIGGEQHVFPLGGAAKAATIEAGKYAEDQPRDDHGRFGEGEGAGSPAGFASNADVETWGKAAYGKDWYRALPPAQQNALAHYQVDGWMNVNTLARGGDLGITKEYATAEQKPVIREIEAMDKALAARPLATDVTSYRAFPLAGSPFEHLAPDQLVGAQILDSGFSSTTLDRDMAENRSHNSGAGVLMTIHVPAGTQAAYLGNTKAVTAGREHELLVHRGAEFTVTRARTQTEMDAYGPHHILHLDVTVI